MALPMPSDSPPNDIWTLVDTLCHTGENDMDDTSTMKFINWFTKKGLSSYYQQLKCVDLARMLLFGVPGEFFYTSKNKYFWDYFLPKNEKTKKTILIKWINSFYGTKAFTQAKKENFQLSTFFSEKIIRVPLNKFSIDQKLDMNTKNNIALFFESSKSSL